MPSKKPNEREFDEATRKQIALEDAWRQWWLRVRDVLNTDWDPIGVAGLCEDEYDEYAKVIAAMIHQGRTDEDLEAYLESAGRACGLDTTRMTDADKEMQRKRTHEIVAALRALGPAPALSLPLEVRRHKPLW